MAGALCKEVPAAKELFNKASAILGYDLLDKVKYDLYTHITYPLITTLYSV